MEFGTKGFDGLCFFADKRLLSPLERNILHSVYPAYSANQAIRVILVNAGDVHAYGRVCENAYKWN